MNPLRVRGSPKSRCSRKLCPISGSCAFDRENLSPFTKDFRAEGHTMSMNSFFGIPSKERDQKLELEKSVKTEDGSRSCTQRQRHQRLQNQRRSSRTIFRPGKRDFMVLEKGKNAYSTLDSQAVSDPSTKRARRCLTWLIGREAVFSTWYGRKRERRQCNAKTIHRSCERVV